MSASRAQDWLRQADEDLRWADHTLNSGFFPQVCFICQQAAEKAMKALALERQFSQTRTHSIVKLATALNVNGEIEAAGRRLDQYYISSRYPDAMPDGIPSEYIDREQAAQAISLAKTIITQVHQLVGNGEIP